jgi:hypothetical protein
LDIRTIKSSPKLLFAVIKINGRFHVALLDTGASINVIPEDLASNVKETKEFKIKGVNGPVMTVNQVAHIKFGLGERPFAVSIYDTVQEARSSLPSERWIENEIFTIKNLETPEEIKSKRIDVVASSLPGFEMNQIIGPYKGQGIHFEPPDSPLKPDTTYIFHVSENYLDRHSLLSANFMIMIKKIDKL